MSAFDERTDSWLRRTLAREPRPSLDPVLSTRVLRRLAERERELQSRRRAGARLLLGAYWLGAALGTLWVLGRLPWPDWVGPVAWGVAVLAAPAGFAVTLWPERARDWLRLCVRPLLPPLER